MIAPIVGIAAGPAMNFAGQYNPVPTIKPFNSSTDDLLAGARTINVCGIDEVYARLNSFSDNLFGHFSGAPGPEVHAAKTQGADLNSSTAKIAIFH